MIENMGHFFSAYFMAQLAILPLLIYFLFFDYSRHNHTTLRYMRTVVSLLVFILPLFFYGLTLFSLNNTSYRGDSSVEPARQILVPGDTEPITREEPAVAVMPETRVFPTSIKPFSIIDAIFTYLSAWLLLAGCAGLLLFLFQVFFQTRRIRTIIEQSKFTTIGGVLVYRHHQIQAPFSVWIGRNMIFMPEPAPGMEDHVILNHEHCHVRRKHTQWAFFEKLLVHLFWYNPLLHFLKSRNEFLREVECDLEVSQMVGRRSYINTMLNHAFQRMGRYHFSMGAGWRKTAFRKRMETLFTEPDTIKVATARPRQWAVLGLTIVLAVIVSGCLSAPEETAIVQKLNETYQNRIQRYGETRLSAMPKHLSRIFMLREDKNFFEHHGLDYVATMRAALNNLRGRPLQGASTITQQLAKGLFYESEPKNLKRKIKQIEAAAALEKHLSKNRIMEMYLNSVYLGEDIYGITAAALHYYHHPVEELTLAEISALAVMVSNPHGNSFKEEPQQAAILQKKLLNRIVAAGMVTSEEALESLKHFQKDHSMI